jgi:TIR domain
MDALFLSYSHKDEVLRDQMETQLTMLKRQGVISVWHDRRLIAGDHVDEGISKQLEAADIILLLVSPDFLASEYCYSVEMTRALERNAAGEARVIPVILRPCEWQHAPFGKLLAAPKDGEPVTKWADPDEAFLDIAKAIRAAARKEDAGSTARPEPRAGRRMEEQEKGPRSSNLRLRKAFTERDRDQFLDEAFEFIARFFENSLGELESRNSGIEGSFKRIDATRFTASVYRGGAALTRCTIRLGGLHHSGITFSHGADAAGNGYNESMSVEVGEQALYLKPMGMAMFNNSARDKTLGLEGAAEYYWQMFIEPLQR